MGGVVACQMSDGFNISQFVNGHHLQPFAGTTLIERAQHAATDTTVTINCYSLDKLPLTGKSTRVNQNGPDDDNRGADEVMKVPTLVFQQLSNSVNYVLNGEAEVLH